MSNRRVSKDVYWRRRLLVLAGLIALLWIGIQVVQMFGGAEKAPDKAAKSTPTTASATPSATEPAPDQVMVSLDTSTTPCKPENLRILPSVAPGQYAGGPIAMDLMIATLDSVPCTFEPTAAELLVVIDAKRAPIYDSSVCRTAFFTAPVQIAGGWAAVTPVEWSGKGSGKACGAGEGFAGPGTYTVKVGTYGGEPGAATFTIVRRPAETTTPTTAPTATPAPTSTPATKQTPKPQ
ncbi:MAG TPA: hypothetical protein PLQ19_08360 [Aeromicrobium sp.]|nr:hypothetical protein [Aeromicrobium sp.]